MKLQKFNNLFNKIIFENIEKIIKYNTFDYTFEIDKDSNKLFCIFNSIDKNDNKLIKIKATIFENNTYEFVVIKDNKEKIYTDKEFLLSYYHEYQDFKTVLKLYEKEKLNDDSKKIDEKEKKLVINGKSIPNIKSFNDVLTDIKNTDEGILLKTNGISFIFKQIDNDIYTNLITISFSFENNNILKKPGDLDLYDAICLVKIHNSYIKILNINLYDPDDLENSNPVIKLTESEFKDLFLTCYFSLKEAIKKYFGQYFIDKKF